MARFNVIVDHGSVRDEVVECLRRFSQQVKESAADTVTEIEESWDQAGNLIFAFRALGFKVSGQMVTCEQQVTVAGSLPFAALPFRGKIEQQVAEKIRQAISEMG